MKCQRSGCKGKPTLEKENNKGSYYVCKCGDEFWIPKEKKKSTKKKST